MGKLWRTETPAPPVQTKNGFIHYDEPKPDAGSPSQSDSELYSKSGRARSPSTSARGDRPRSTSPSPEDARTEPNKQRRAKLGKRERAEKKAARAGQEELAICVPDVSPAPSLLRRA